MPLGLDRLHVARAEGQPIAAANPNADGEPDAQPLPNTDTGGAVLSKLKKILGVLTDLLLVGRNKGWWSRKQGPR